MIVGIEPVLGEASMSGGIGTGDAPDNVKDAGMVRGKDGKGAWIDSRLRIAGMIRQVIVHPWKRARGVGSKVSSTGIGLEVIFHRYLTALSIVVTDNAIVWLIVLLYPEGGRIPILGLW